jgi:hypothetical protein
LARYESIDAGIDTWVVAHGLVLFREFGGVERRFCYISSEQGECFQISIEPPLSKIVTISIWSIETTDDEELHRAWTVPTSYLPAALEDALQTVENWKRGIGRSE